MGFSAIWYMSIGFEYVDLIDSEQLGQHGRKFHEEGSN